MDDSHPAFRRLVIVALAGATAGMVVVSMRANYLFGYGFGHSPEKALIFGWANVAADLWKVFGLVVITSLWRAKRFRIAMCLLPIWLVCVMWGLISAIGIYAQERGAVVGGREARVAALEQAERDLRAIDAELGRLPHHRSTAELDAAIAAVLARPIGVQDRPIGTVGSLSETCTKANRRTLEACAEVAALEQERARARAAAQLHARRDEARARVGKLRTQGDAIVADPIADLLAWLSQQRLSSREVAFSFPLVFAFLIEVVSAFGPAGIVAYAEATRQRSAVSSTQPATARRGKPRPVAASNGAHEHVATWMAERTEPAVSGSVSLADLHRDYTAWCAGKGSVPLASAEFRSTFGRTISAPELGGVIHKIRSKYRGLKIIANPGEDANARRKNGA